MQIDRPHVLYNFERGNTTKSKKDTIPNLLSRPVNRDVDARCLALQQKANEQMSLRHQQTDDRGVVIPFEQLISANSNYTIKL